jgi:hypothetical protein
MNDTINMVTQHFQTVIADLRAVEDTMTYRRADQNLRQFKPDNVARMRVARALQAIVNSLPYNESLSYFRSIATDFVATLPKVCRDELNVEISPTANDPVVEATNPTRERRRATSANVVWTDEDVQSLKRFTFGRFQDAEDSSRNLYECFLDSDYMTVLNESRNMIQAKRKVRALWKEMNRRFAATTEPAAVETESTFLMEERATSVLTLELPASMPNQNL